jgi:hypothetical protein
MFHGDPTLRARLHEALRRMLAFYGLAETMRDGRAEIARSAGFAAKSRNWLQPGNHNHLRLSRILACLRLLGLDDQSRALLTCLEGIAAEHPHVISPTTLAYWRRAADPGAVA